ncbi:ATP-binding protein [Chromobacterium haemolyticum]|uniref:ATP-binding protein n=1 Tax=Chromobacterium haemolyticum TaxID=394935 RepID=UPI001317038C|nr:ATP-binding protein [Chromobacterium haemolyticum]MDH0340307.1 ATP-binding protein [Chromobacterium haemolyticum]BBH14782.1 two-component sensor histidine kinase [Chromobacterium haemolyticum]
MRGPRSLQARLLLLLLLIVPVIWLVASATAAWLAHEEVDELFDTQMGQFARQLLLVDVGDEEVIDLPKLKHLLKHADKGQLDNDDFGLAVWDRHGRLLLSDGRGRRFDFEPERRGFYDYRGKDSDHDWRLIYLAAPDGSRLVAVGQKQGLRHDMVLKVVSAQLLPWLLGLPVMLLLILLAVRRELGPLKRLAAGLAQRAPDDSEPVSREVPREVMPLVDALNALFARIASTLEHERRFTADAAHELRTPLAALKVQAEVLELLPDEGRRKHALRQLMLGIDRATRLVEQLLALSRLDPLSRPGQGQPIAWATLAERLLAEMAAEAALKGVKLETEWRCVPERALPLSGDETLVGLMLRNLLENAIRYGAEGGEARLVLAEDAVSVLDRGPGVAAEWLARIRERFFRPPGQDVAGSGLGLSIVERVAELHGLRLSLANRDGGGLEAGLRRR